MDFIKAHHIHTIMKRITLFCAIVASLLCACVETDNEEHLAEFPTIGIEVGKEGLPYVVESGKGYAVELSFDKSAKEFTIEAFYDGKDGRNCLYDRLSEDQALPDFIRFVKRERINDLRSRYTFSIAENPEDTLRVANIMIIDDRRPASGPWANYPCYCAVGTILVVQSKH